MAIVIFWFRRDLRLTDNIALHHAMADGRAVLPLFIFDTDILGHFWRSFCDTAKLNLHIDQKYGDDLHHAHEAVFKAVARALRMACTADPRALNAVPSSKGKL